MRILHWDAHTASVRAALLARLKSQGLSMPVKDSLIAACALAQELTIVTRNRSDFEKSGLHVLLSEPH